MSNKLLNLANVAEMLGVSLEDVKDLIDCGDLTAVGSNKNWVKSADLDKFIGNDTASSANTDVSTFLASIDKKEDIVPITKYGEGSVYWNATRKCYQAAFYLTMSDGRKKRRVVSGRTEIEVIGKMQMEKMSASGAGATVPAIPTVPNSSSVIMIGSSNKGENKKFSVVADEYMKIADKHNGDNTYRNKLSMLKPIMSFFGDMLIDDIEYTDVQAFLDAYSVFEDGTLRSDASIKNTYTLLKSIFNYAANKKRPYIDNAPMYGVKIPTGTKTKKEDLLFTKDELIAIFRSCLNHPRYLTLATLMLEAGARGEEFTAIRWSDIDFDKKTIDITRAFVIKKNDTDEKKWKRDIDKTKSDAGVRKIHFGDSLYKQLIEWRKYLQNTAEYQKAIKKGNEDYIFINKNGDPVNVDTLRKNFSQYFERRAVVNKTVTFHKFRRSFATWAKSEGVDPFVIKVWMGHSLEDNITESAYTDVTDDMAAQASSIIDAFVAKMIAKAKELRVIENPKGRNGKK